MDACHCDECDVARRNALAAWSAAKEQHPGAVVFLQVKGSTAAYALGQDARNINAICGHMIRTDEFGCPDVFVCNLDGVRRSLRSRLDLDSVIVEITLR